MSLKDRLKMQLAEALGPENRWFCSEFHGREITDPDVLLSYYIKHGGAEGFAKRKGQMIPSQTGSNPCK